MSYGVVGGVTGVSMHQGSADAMEELLGPFPVVRLRGLPFEAQVRDVILFFQVRGWSRVLSVRSGLQRCRGRGAYAVASVEWI